MHLKRLSVLLFLIAVTLLSPALWGQDSSSMTGIVTDATGAVVPGVTVTLSNSLTNAHFTQKTDRQGAYRFANVPPTAGYTALFELAGFASTEVADITLSVGVTRTQDARLAAGANEVVEISASSSAVTLDTTDASISNNINVGALNQLPVQDRTSGVTTLFNLQPGVVDTQLDTSNSDVSGAVTGARTDQTSVTVDGLDVNDIAAGTTFAVIATAPVDSVEQFTGTVGGLVPSLGTGSGGQFQLVTKQGTNQFHGNLNEYHRDTSTESNTYFNNDVGVARTPLIRNQFGGNIGGPILKNKLFFFFDFADSRIIQSSASEPSVPIPSLYSATPTLNYINDGAGCGDSSRLNTQPTCISSINAAQAAALDPAGIGFDPSVLSFFKSRYPAPNDSTQGDGVNTEGLRFTYPTPRFQTTYVGRVDYNLTSTQKIYGRATINRTSEVYTGPHLPGDPSSVLEIDHSYGYVVSHIWTLGSNKVNQFYYGDNISKLNFPVGDFPTSPNNYTFSSTSGELADPYGTGNSQDRRVPIPVVRDDFNWKVGSHSLTMGGLFKFIKTNSNSINDYNFVDAGLQGSNLQSGLEPSVRPSMATLGPTAANINTNSNIALDDYDQIYAASLGVIGEISSNFDYNKSGQETPQGLGGPRAYRYFETEAYVGDTWNVNKKLTLTYGLRYQLYSVPYEVHGDESVSEVIGLTQRQSTFNAYFNDRLKQNAAGAYGDSTLPFFQEILGGKANNGPSSYAPSYKDFAPRFAFAYTPSSLHNTVFNGSAAIDYDRSVINAINFLQDQLSFLFYNNNTVQFGSSSGPAASLAVDPRLGANLSYSSSLNPTPTPIMPPYIPYVNGGTPVGLAGGEEGFVIDPQLKDPYSIALNAGVQQELPGHMILKLNYVGRLGRRLLADADASQVLNFPDNLSGQTLSQAFGNLTVQQRANPSATTYTAQPWFEDLVGGTLGGCTAYAANCTSLVASQIGQLGYRGDIGDAIYTLYAEGLLPANVGIPGQFGTQGYLTNKGSSSYNGLLVTLSKNLSQGLQFDVNYTWSHSIDNNSQAANNNALFNATGIICDVTRPRACRGNSDFDVRSIVTADFSYALPFGHNAAFLGNSSTLVNELVGGWSLSGLPSFRSGLSVNVLSDAFLASFAAEDPAIFSGNRSDLTSHPNNVQGTVYNFAGGPTGAQKVFSEFRGPIGLEYGQRNIAKGPGAVNLDLGLAKIFPVLPEKHVNLVFRADAFNLLNHPNFSNPGAAGSSTFDIVNNANPFGQITSTISPSGQIGDVRVGQFSLRLEF